jgi:hypothetical protein
MRLRRSDILERERAAAERDGLERAAIAVVA